MVAFEEKLTSVGMYPLLSDRIETLQVNMGRRCNQTCNHCHVEAGPYRTEVMSRQVVEAVLRALRDYEITTLDITGGAPETNPHFELLVDEATTLGRHVRVRSNLTIYLEQDRQHLPLFLRDRRAEIVASLPCYLQENIDAQRGAGTAEKSVRVLRRLNELGYGRPDSGLTLNLVYNPLGPSLPPDQAELEMDYKRELRRRYGVVFNRLFTLTNVPLGRFRSALSASGKLGAYMKKLGDAFNPGVVESLMCRNLVSVGWDGLLYDCDFNQVLSLPVVTRASRIIDGFDRARLAKRKIVTGDHCYACTAGAGSSCRGALN